MAWQWCVLTFLENIQQLLSINEAIIIGNLVLLFKTILQILSISEAILMQENNRKFDFII